MNNEIKKRKRKKEEKKKKRFASVWSSVASISYLRLLGGKFKRASALVVFRVLNRGMGDGQQRQGQR